MAVGSRSCASSCGRRALRLGDRVGMADDRGDLPSAGAEPRWSVSPCPSSTASSPPSRAAAAAIAGAIPFSPLSKTITPASSSIT